MRPPPYFLQNRGEDGGGITVLRRVLAVELAELLQAGQLQGVQIRGVVLRQVSVSLQLQGGQKTYETQRKKYPDLQPDFSEPGRLTRAVISCSTWTSDRKSKSAWKAETVER